MCDSAPALRLYGRKYGRITPRYYKLKPRAARYAAINMKKPTLTTLKSFMRRNRGNLYVSTLGSFDGTTDSVEQHSNRQFHPARATEKEGETIDEHTMGIAGVWIVRGGRDIIEAYDDEQYEGYRVDNCCGAFIVARKKGYSLYEIQQRGDHKAADEWVKKAQSGEIVRII